MQFSINETKKKKKRIARYSFDKTYRDRFENPRVILANHRRSIRRSARESRNPRPIKYILSDVTRQCRLSLNSGVFETRPPARPNLGPEDAVSLQRQLSCSRILLTRTIPL